MTWHNNLLYPELCFPGKSSLLIVQCMIWLFSQILSCEEAYCYTRVHSFCWESDDFNHITASWVSPQNQQFILHWNFMQRSNILIWQGHGSISKCNCWGSLHLISLWIYLLNVKSSFQPKFVFVRSYSGTNVFRTVPKILSDFSLVQKEGKNLLHALLSV